jgi:serine/threonine-protein kinase HSL1 (negative regulator of Swe1 kinase)
VAIKYYTKAELGRPEFPSAREVQEYNSSMIQNLEHEQKVMARFNHPNIIQCFEYGEAPILRNGVRERSVYFLVLEYLPNGTLFDLLKKINEPPIELVRYIFHQLTLMIQHMFSMKVVHADIKLENIMIDGEGRLKLIDFGHARDVGDRSLHGLIHGPCGTIMYQCPQLVEGMLRIHQRVPGPPPSFHGYSGDIFSFGVVLFCLLAKNYPFSQASKQDFRYNLFATHNYGRYWAEVLQTTKYPANFTPEVCELLTAMMQYEPEARITIPEILSHAWLTRTPILPDAEARALLCSLCQLPKPA